MSQAVKAENWAQRKIEGMDKILAVSKAVAQETSPAEYEPICDDDMKYEIAKILAESPTQRKPLSQEAIAFQKKVYEKFSFCAQDAYHQPPVDRREFCSRVSAVARQPA